MENEGTKTRIGNITAVLLIGVALIFDVVEVVLTATVLLAPLQSFVSLFAVCVFSFWLFMLGVGLLSPKKFLVSSGAALLEVFPLTGWLPMWTIGIILIISMVRLEDKTGVSIKPHLAGNK
ncbi:MAG: hypothetical protein WDZ88_01850 [Candidatus Paceibacterota bacterium]